MKSILTILFVTLFYACSQSSEENKLAIPKTDQELMELADHLAHKYIITDGHVDLPYRMETQGFMRKQSVEDVSVETQGNFDYPKAKKGGLDAPFMSIYIPAAYQETGGAKEFADSLIDLVARLPVSFPTMFGMANTPAAIKSNFEKGLISLPMGMENGAPIENDINNVKYFFERGIRYITLTHSKDNQICDSSYDTTEDTWNGLSPFGEEVLKEMNRVGIMVDISHVSDSAFYDAIKIARAPMIASHSSCRKFTPGFMRNMSDEMIRLLAENGGVIHLNFGSSFLSKESQDKFEKMEEHLTNYRVENNLSENDSSFIAYSKNYAIEMDVFEDIKKVADHIDNVVNVAGIDFIGFGSDFDGVGDSLPIGLKDVSMFPNLIFELLKRGYTEEDIEKICYKNTFRVWNEVAKKASELQNI